MKSYSKPTSDQVSAAAAKLVAPQHVRYFFDKLENQLWIVPLEAHMMFVAPPSAERTTEGGIRCRPWPQSRFLARMATAAPSDVARIMAKWRTDNWVVAHDIVDAAKAMPPEAAAELVDAIVHAVSTRYSQHLLDDVGEIVAALAGGEHCDVAVKLAQGAFAIKGIADTSESGQRDDYGYFEGLTKHVVPALAIARPAACVALVSGWMRDTLAMEPDGGDSLDRTSTIWCPAIEDSEQSHRRFAAKMLGCLRQACELSIRSGGVTLDQVLKRLSKRDGRVFGRLSVHLIAEFADQNLSLTKTSILDKDKFADFQVRREYARLLSLRWELLDNDEQATWLSMVDAGPAPRDFDATDSEEMKAKRREYWQFERLHWIRAYLTGERLAFYQRMAKEYGASESQQVDEGIEDTSWGHVSPIPLAELEQGGFSGAVSAIKAWAAKPGSRIDDFDLRALGGAFRELVAKEPTQCSKQASLLEDSLPVVVLDFFGAMRDAVKAGVDIELRDVLSLAAWVSRRPVDPSDVDRGMDWQQAKDAVASFVEEVAEAVIAGRPRYGAEFGDQLLEVISSLQNCSDSEFYYGKKTEDLRNVNWPIVVLNSSRGKAALALLAYGEWLASHEVNGDRNIVPVPGGLNARPKLKSLLNGLIHGHAPARSGYAALGYRLWLLQWYDPSWVREHVATIFNLRAIESDPQDACGWAAWVCFLFGHRPHPDFFALLRGQYSYSVDQASVHLEDEGDEKWQMRLAEHLIMLYGRGEFGTSGRDGMEAADAIIWRLVTKTHVAVRSHALEYAGEMLSASRTAIPPDAIDRLKHLWDEYWSAVGRADAEADGQSRVFGHWFGSGAFDPAWSIDRLHAFVTAAPRTSHDSMILKQLALICGHDCQRSAENVEILVKGDADGWRVYAWREHAKAILRKALLAGGGAEIVARNVVDLLGRRGFDDFRTVLDPD